MTCSPFPRHLGGTCGGVAGVQNRFGSVFFTQLFFSFFGLQAMHDVEFFGEEWRDLRSKFLKFMRTAQPARETSRTSPVSKACTLWYLDRDRLDRERASKLYHAGSLSQDNVRMSWRLCLHCDVFFQLAGGCIVGPWRACGAWETFWETVRIFVTCLFIPCQVLAYFISKASSYLWWSGPWLQTLPQNRQESTSSLLAVSTFFKANGNIVNLHAFLTAFSSWISATALSHSYPDWKSLCILTIHSSSSQQSLSSWSHWGPLHVCLPWVHQLLRYCLIVPAIYVTASQHIALQIAVASSRPRNLQLIACQITGFALGWHRLSAHWLSSSALRVRPHDQEKSCGVVAPSMPPAMPCQPI